MSNNTQRRHYLHQCEIGKVHKRPVQRVRRVKPKYTRNG